MSGDTITIAPGTYTENLVVGPATATPLTLRKAVAGSGDVIVDGNAINSVLRIASAHTVELLDLTLRNGKAPVESFGGGGILNQGTLRLRRARVTANTAGLRGGGIANIGTLELDQRVTPARATGVPAVLVRAFTQVVTADPLVAPRRGRCVGV